ncbi:MAG: MMPL family transporter [Candidatus Thermoplasmatota archaeon]|nr:MMPL family transporter [Candidatus Thermoplasmatota archaeon]
MRIETDMTAYLPSDVPVVQALNEVASNWATEYYILLIKSDNVLDREVLDEMQRVESMVNPDVNDGGLRDGVVYTMSISSVLSIMPFDVSPQSIISILPSEITGMLVNEDMTQTAMLVGVYPFANRTALTQRIRAVVEDSSLNISITGLPVISEEVTVWAYDQMYIILLVVIILFAVIYAFHRTIKSIFICLIPSILAMAQTYGLLVLSRVTLTPEIVLLVAPMSLALGVNYAIYLMERFSSTNSADAKERLYKTVRTTGIAILLSALTTIVGFVSLVFGILPSVRVLGIALVMAISLVFISTAMLVPALILILKYEKRGSSHLWQSLSEYPIKHAKAIVSVILIFTIASLFCITTVSTSANYMEMVPETIPSINTMMDYSKNMSSSAQPNMMLVKGNITDVRALKALDNFINELNTIENVSAFGIPAVYRAIWENTPLFPELYGSFPSEQWQINILNHLMTSFAGDEILSTFVSGNSTIIMVNTPMMGIEESTRIVTEINRLINETSIPGCEISQLTGSVALTVEINNMLLTNQQRTLIISLILIFFMVTLIFRSLKLGLLVMIPPVLVVAWEPLLLFLINIPLSLITISLGSIMIGIGVDYGIEIVQRARDEGMGIKGMETSIRHTGMALTQAVVTEVFGLAPALLIEITPVRQFILLLMLMIATAYMFAVFFLPAVYSLFRREHGGV